MAKQLKIKDWLNDFLASRELDAPDGRHLFSYHATPDEFLTLEEGLKQNMTLASMLGLLSVGQCSRLRCRFCALCRFVLAAKVRRDDMDV